MSSGYKFGTREELRNVINLWISDKASTTRTYGDINTWDVSAITNFSYLFSNKTSFNSNISNWDVSNGNDFSYMFDGAGYFNQDIGDWDVSNGTDFSFMFRDATSFNQDIGDWDVSSGINFSYMFADNLFNKDISQWDVSSGSDFSYMFSKTESERIVEWTRFIGSSESEEGKDVIVGIDNDIYIVGNTNGNLDGQENNGGVDIFLSKFQTNGTKEWTKLIGTSDDDNVSSIEMGSDGSIYILGNSYGDINGQSNNGKSDIFITKLNSNGDLEWSKIEGYNNDDFGNSITINDEGFIYIIGTSYIDIDDESNRPKGHIYISKLNSDGDKQWSKLRGSSEKVLGESITSGDDGSLYITGSEYYYREGVTYFDFDTYETKPLLLRDAFLEKLDSDGNVIWSRLLGSEWWAGGHALVTDTNGNIYQAGYILTNASGEVKIDGEIYSREHTEDDWHSSYDAFVSKFDDSGSREWIKLIGTPFIKPSREGDDYANDIAFHDDSIYLVGTIEGPLYESNQLVTEKYEDIFLTKFDLYGEHQWTEAYYSNGLDYDFRSFRDFGNAININEDGNIYILGETKGDRLEGEDATGDYDTNDSDAVLISIKSYSYPKNINLSNPTNINLSKFNIDENIDSTSWDAYFPPKSILFASIQSEDSDLFDFHEYSLVNGENDNDKFFILGDQLILSKKPDYETQSSYNIRLKTTDSGGLSYEESFTLYVNDLEEKIDPITGETIAIPPFNLDVDGDGKVTALGDGLMVIKKLFGSAFAGDKLCDGTISPDATRTCDEIHEFIQTALDDGILDVDGDGGVTALGDGLMVIRKLFGAAFDGDKLTAQAISSDATRTTDEIHEYIAAMSNVDTIA